MLRTICLAVAFLFSLVVCAQPSSPPASGLRYAVVDANGNAGPAAATPPPEGDQVLVFYLGGIAALAPGQMFRYSWTNLTHTDPARRHVTPLSVQFTLFKPDGTPLARGGGPAVGPGEFATFDVDYDSIARAGEPGTGRVQFKLEVGTVVTKAPGTTKWSNIELKRGIDTTFDDTAEVFDRITGRTTLT